MVIMVRMVAKAPSARRMFSMCSTEANSSNLINCNTEQRGNTVNIALPDLSRRHSADFGQSSGIINSTIIQLNFF